MAKYSCRLSPSLDGLKRGGLLKYLFNYWNAVSHSSVHTNACFNVLKKGRHLSIALETNLLMATILPVSFWISLTVLGKAILMMA